MAQRKNIPPYGTARALVLAALAYAGAAASASAQTPAPAPPSAAAAAADREGATSLDEIIVEGSSPKEVRAFLQRAIVATGDVVTRRTAPVCIGIDNAPASLADPIRARILQNLGELGIETAPPGCRVNAAIVFHPDAHAFVNWLAKRGGGAAFSALFAPEKRRLIGPVRQAYAWHHIPAEAERLDVSQQVLTGLNGDSIGPPPISMDTTRGRIMTALTPATTSHSFAVIDTDAIAGLTYDQVGDWLTMQILVETRPRDDAQKAAPGGSILSLFTATGHDPAAPERLTRLDRAILSQIYGKSGNLRAGTVRLGAAREARREQARDDAALAAAAAAAAAAPETPDPGARAAPQP